MRRLQRLWLLLLLLALLSTTVHHRVSAVDEDVETEEEEDAFSDEGLGYDEYQGDAGADSQAAREPPATTSTDTPVPTVQYSKPSTDGLDFAETFDGDVFSRWIKSANDKFSGEWGHVARQTEAIVGDKGLRVMNEARHHGISSKMPTAMKNNKGQSVAVSYEVKFEDMLNCGGAYLKLFSTSTLPSKGSDMSEFDSETPYVVMFGPDRCGTTNKVHLIIKQLNPVSKKWVEHHLDDAPRIPHGETTHQFSFVVKPDNTYEIILDGKSEKSGDMTKDFRPPFTPPKEIDDPNETKPEDWVDELQIPDPSAVKPEDWNEDAPRTIPDPEAVMPDGWLVDEPLMTKDVNAEKPEDWNEEEDGEWTAPQVKNPACVTAPGCGEWKAPMVPNPDYKGKWARPMIDNPAYKGEWKARQIENPDYFLSDSPHALADFDAVGFELWTMQKGILFDNIVAARSMEAIQAFVARTWKIRSEIEKAQVKANLAQPHHGIDEMKTAEKVMTRVMLFASQYPLGFGVGLASAILFLFISVIKMCKSRPQPAVEGKDKVVEKKDAKAQKGSDKASSGSEVAEGESEEKEGEVLKGKKGAEKARQRRAKKD